jgi:pilus assembly protein CpaE
MAIIPFEPQLFGAAANNGQMIAEISAGHKTADMFRALARDLTGRAEPIKKSSSFLSPLLEKLLGNA